jgi:predicted helicase
MANSGQNTLLESLKSFADALKRSYGSLVAAQQEDQLKGPTGGLLEAFGSEFGLDVLPRFEAPVPSIGRPDIALDVGGALCGYVELKAPTESVRASDFRGRNRKQFNKFKTLPNLIYTNGNEWILYQNGERKQAVRLSGDAVEEGASALEDRDAERLSAMLRDFLNWNPIVPTSPKALAELLAPLCHLLRDDVTEALDTPESAISQLADEWRAYLFPEADNRRFADAYAQTLTYALLLARMEGEVDLSISAAAHTLQSGHGLLSQALTLLADPQARAELATGVGLLERTIAAVDPKALTRKDADPWLYFYEDFLAAYDRRLRNDAGVYYTPVEVVRAQVNLVSELLRDMLGMAEAFADDDVTVLDPATGTGTYPLAILDHGLDAAEEMFGPGMRGSTASEMAKKMHAFESLVGPYAVAHLKVSKKILDEGGSLPDDDLHVYLTDTLESPHAIPLQPPLVARKLGEEHRRALRVKRDTPVLVCIGNPPYDRQEIDPDDETTARKGGWVRFGEGGDGPDGTLGGNLSTRTAKDSILEDFLRPAREAGAGGHLKNLYNDYVYFWRWALWKVFERQEGPGIVSFITASSYLRGPGFVGMREVMRRTFDDLWILDLEGDNVGARKTENVFAIQTPVAIATGVRYGEPKPDEPAHVHYAKIEGTKAEKLTKLYNVKSFRSLDWKPCMEDWQKPLLPEGEGDYYAWPRLKDVFPWQQGGIKAGRTWPIAESKDTLQRRWSVLVGSDRSERQQLFKDSPTGKKNTMLGSMNLLPTPASNKAIRDLAKGDPEPQVVRYAYRSLDRQWIFADNRLLDRAGPPLWLSHGPNQVYLTSLLTDVLGDGPAATVSSGVPDLHHFSGRGGKDVIPLWRNASATQPNTTDGLLDMLSTQYGETVGPEDLFAYACVVLGSPAYTKFFAEELSIPGPNLPITKDHNLFRRGVEIGRWLIGLHTYGERFGGSVPSGTARIQKAIPDTSQGYPEEFSYDPVEKTITFGEGEIRPVAPEVYNYNVSGLEVVKSWLGYRRKHPRGRSSSPLDEIRPERWTGEMTRELLELLWVLEATVEREAELAELLAEITASEVFTADELPEPTEEERKPPKIEFDTGQDSLH